MEIIDGVLPIVCLKNEGVFAELPGPPHEKMPQGLSLLKTFFKEMKIDLIRIVIFDENQIDLENDGH